MNVCVREIIEAFPGREVSLITRPDGRLSLTIGGEAQPAFHRVIDCESVLSRAQVGGLIRELVHDVQASGDRQPGQGASWLARERPVHDLASPFAARALTAHGDDPRSTRASC